MCSLDGSLAHTNKVTYFAGSSAVAATKVGQDSDSDLEHWINNVVVTVAFCLLKQTVIYFTKGEKRRSECAQTKI